MTSIEFTTKTLLVPTKESQTWLCNKTITNKFLDKILSTVTESTMPNVWFIKKEDSKTPIEQETLDNLVDKDHEDCLHSSN